MSKVNTELNPFLDGKPIKVIENVERYQQVNLKGKRREVTDYFESDYHDYTKVYMDFKVYPNLYDLTPAALKLFMYVVRHLPRGKDYLEVSKDKASKEIKVQKSAFYKAKDELISAKILIKRKGRSKIYWVNPHFLFKGKRPDSIREAYGEDSVIIQSRKEYSSK
jgi:hypothetical protein